jgi:hypothetical protein
MNTAVLAVSTVFIIIYLWRWSGTESTITAAIYWPIVQALNDGVSGMNEWQVKPKYSEETCLSDALSTTDPT